jgi:hypothetical protein
MKRQPPARFADKQFPVYAKLADGPRSGKEAVADLVEQALGHPPSQAMLNMWKMRGRIPYKYQILIMEECRRKGVEANSKDFVTG